MESTESNANETPNAGISRPVAWPSPDRNDMSEVTTRHNFNPACTVCGRAASKIQLFTIDGVWKLIYEGPDSGSGSGGVEIGPDSASAIISGFTEPYSKEKIRAADLYDDGGFCLECSKFYCWTHWNVSTTGGGRCPNGHFKSLDPHWDPEI